MAKMKPNSRCKSCDAEVIWVRMETGKLMPVDKKPVKDGNICVMLDRDTGNHTGWYAREQDKAQTYVSHFATCPDAKKWRG